MHRPSVPRVDTRSSAMRSTSISEGSPAPRIHRSSSGSRSTRRPGRDPAAITVSRTNADDTTDVALACETLGHADPDPCFTAAFVAGPGSDVLVTVYTTHASKWLVLERTDFTPPVVTSASTGTLGTNGWYTGNIGVRWTVTDPESAIIGSTGCADTIISTDTGGTIRTCQATSVGGTTSRSVTFKRDASFADGHVPDRVLCDRCVRCTRVGHRDRCTVRPAGGERVGERRYDDGGWQIREPDGTRSRW